MIERVKSLALELVLGFVLTMLDRLLQAGFLQPFLEGNLITILVALFAINITTISIIMSKLNDLREKNAATFPTTTKELRSSIIEQVIQVVAAIVVLIAAKSVILVKAVPYWSVGATVVLSAILVASLLNLYDTGKAVFVLYNYEKKD